jgi:hypothetical protein
VRGLSEQAHGPFAATRQLDPVGGGRRLQKHGCASLVASNIAPPRVPRRTGSPDEPPTNRQGSPDEPPRLSFGSPAGVSHMLTFGQPEFHPCVLQLHDYSMI